jgi:hypothetical protein
MFRRNVMLSLVMSPTLTFPRRSALFPSSCSQVACAKAGVGIADIEAHLDRRALKIRRRPGDSKPARIAAAQAHFEAVAAAGGSATHSPHS